MRTLKQNPEVYDHLYVTGGYEGIYHLPYRRSQYYPLFKSLYAELSRLRVRSVLDVGCGNGAFGHMCLDKGRIEYRGFDFSPIAVEMAKQRCGRSDIFTVADATEHSVYKSDFDSIVCSEVLEHLPNDLDVVDAWPSGTKCVCSVPNFDSRYHERFFASVEAVRSRYGAMIAIDRVTQVYVPILADLTVRNRFKAARANWRHPKRALAAFGFPRLVSSRRWFVIVGTKL